MKVITKTVIRISDGKILEEESFDYNGPIAECKGGGSKVKYEQSPEQRQLFQMMMPMIRDVIGSAVGTPHQIGTEAKQVWVPASGGGYAGFTGDILPGLESIYGYGSNYASRFSPYIPGHYETQQVPVMSTEKTPLYDIPEPYGIPSTEALKPTAGWWEDISPEVKQGLWAPWNEAADILTERLGSRGQAGSARGGYSGTAGAALGKLYSEAGKNVGLQGWQMTHPADLLGWQTELDRNKELWGSELSRNIAPFNLAPAFMGTAGNLTPTGMVSPKSNTMGAIGSGIMGATMPALMGASNPWLGVPLGIAGFLGGK